MNYKIVILLIFFAFLGSTIFVPIESDLPTSPKFYPKENFYKYWHNNKAEINHYHLFQSRYGEIREGMATLIFVTEDFSPLTHLKTDKNPNSKSILKLNMIKKFKTGVYDYYMMLSVFSDVENSGYFPYKISSSVSEWCGQSYSQLLQVGSSFAFTEHSYLGENAEFSNSMPLILSQDAFWNIIRINPDWLPTGELMIIPNLFQLRLRIQKPKPEKVIASKKMNQKLPVWLEGKTNLITYELFYPNDSTEFTYYFNNKFPYRIEGWEEVYFEKVNGKNEMAYSYAILSTAEQSDYWNKNKLINE